MKRLYNVGNSFFKCVNHLKNKDCKLRKAGNTKGGLHCTIDLLFDWFGLICFANKNKNCQLSYS